MEQAALKPDANKKAHFSSEMPILLLLFHPVQCALVSQGAGARGLRLLATPCKRLCLLLYLTGAHVGMQQPAVHSTRAGMIQPSSCTTRMDFSMGGGGGNRYGSGRWSHLKLEGQNWQVKVHSE